MIYSKSVSPGDVSAYEGPLAQRESLVREARKEIKEEEVRRGEKDEEGLKGLWVHQERVASEESWDILDREERKATWEM